ncbi:kinetochore protein spc25 [Gossypium australe]|uniref:Kinetochore protein spc25 n=1 Tax=Gossypium australe TaxID=47621 RepID=A0A5B6UEG1_9ROSI|nr:kinetochore protein spc25 [Gossypium australe]
MYGDCGTLDVAGWSLRSRVWTVKLGLVFLALLSYKISHALRLKISLQNLGSLTSFSKGASS